VLWQRWLGIFDRAYAHTTAGSSEEHTNVAPDLFTVETPLGTYRGLDEQVSKTSARRPSSISTTLEA
jgi:hypothetical protein